MIAAAAVKLYPNETQKVPLGKHFGSGRFDSSSKLCSRCGNIKHGLKPSDRAYRCDECRLVIDRYYNASKNIRGMGLIKVGPVRPEFTPVEIATSGLRGLCPYGRMSVPEAGSPDASADG